MSKSLLEKAKSRKLLRKAHNRSIRPTKDENAELLCAYLNGDISLLQMGYALGAKSGGGYPLARLCIKIQQEGVTRFSFAPTGATPSAPDRPRVGRPRKRKVMLHQTCTICNAGFKRLLPQKTCGKASCRGEQQSRIIKEWHRTHPGMMKAAIRRAHDERRARTYRNSLSNDLQPSGVAQ